jgi:SAM-dependent methyltransferase
VNLDDRAFIAVQAMGIMTARTLKNSHPALLGILAAGMSVLDVGCGPGTLTAEIARRVDPGAVVGMDANLDMIRAAEEANPPGSVPNLVFYTGDIRESGWDGEFDLVNAARMLQWVPDPASAMRRMARAAVPGSLVAVSDFDHTRAEWSDPPRAWTRFYGAFLGWREAGGLDNAIARRLPALSEAAGLVPIEWRPQVMTVRAGDADFFRVAGRWRMVAESRGREMVAAGHITEDERGAALEAFTEWMTRADATQTLHEAFITARRPQGPLRRPSLRRRRGPGALVSERARD